MTGQTRKGAAQKSAMFGQKRQFDEEALGNVRSKGQDPWPTTGSAARPRTMTSRGNGRLATQPFRQRPRLLGHCDPARPLVLRVGEGAVGRRLGGIADFGACRHG